MGSTDIATLGAHMEHVREDISEMKVTIADVAKAVHALAAVEIKQAEQSSAIGRAFGEIGNVRKRVEALEVAQPVAKQTQGLVNKAVEYVLIAVLAALLALVVVKPEQVKAVPAVHIPQKAPEAQANGSSK